MRRNRHGNNEEKNKWRVKIFVKALANDATGF